MTSVSEITLAILRHGQTPGNAERRYVGSRDDQPLSELGRTQALEASRRLAAVDLGAFSRVYVTRLARTRETAEIMFPGVEQIVVDGIEEMDFGTFTGRTADEMADDLDYLEWVEGWCEGACPGGESKAAFNERVCQAMARFLREAWARGERNVVLVAHGGTQMAFLSNYAEEQRTYYEWLVGNCEGYRMRVRLGEADILATNVEKIPPEII